MASGDAMESNKRSTSFTLPISCQICLGKVKQPVLCSNCHVFCQLCLDIWLQRNNQCPTCRVDIGSSNPVKQIIGGQLEEEASNAQSTPNLRRARFDLLYKEYEDQFDVMRKELIILRTENNILAAQLKDIEREKQPNGETSEAPSPTPSNKNIPSLLQLTSNLQEAQKLYSDIKNDMTRLKEENSKLKDESVNLTRENENLKLEIAERSPKKYGRYTVATLEAKLSASDKEVRQLTSALERSDGYIEELEQEINALSNVNKELKEQINGRGDSTEVNYVSQEKEKRVRKTHHYPVVKNVQKFQFSLDPQLNQQDSDLGRAVQSSGFSVNEVNDVPRGDQQKEPAKRILFGKVFVGESDSRNICKNSNVSGSNEDSSSKKTDFVFSFDNEEAVQPHSSVGRDKDENPVFPESIMKTRTSVRHRSESDSNPMEEMDEERVPKKVHFNVPSHEANDTSSFSLEMPSPLEKATRYTSEPSTSMTNSANAFKKGRDSSLFIFNDKATSSSKTEVSSISDNVATSEFDKRIISLLQKAIASPKNIDKSCTNTSSELESPGGLLSETGRKGSSSVSMETEDSSHLSVPEEDSLRMKHIKSELLDLNSHLHRSKAESSSTSRPDQTFLDMSMTPELNDCLRLMNRAEKNVHEMSSAMTVHQEKSVKAQASFIPDSSVPSTSLGGGSAIQRPVQSGLSNGSHRAVASATVGGQAGTGTGSMSRWEQDFFTSLSKNPYTSNSLTKSNNNGNKVSGMPTITSESVTDYPSERQQQQHAVDGASAGHMGPHHNVNFRNQFDNGPSSSSSMESRIKKDPASGTNTEYERNYISNPFSFQSIGPMPFGSRDSASSNSVTPNASTNGTRLAYTSSLFSHAQSDFRPPSTTQSTIPPHAEYTTAATPGLSSESHSSFFSFDMAHSQSTSMSDLEWPDSTSKIKVEWPDDSYTYTPAELNAQKKKVRKKKKAGVSKKSKELFSFSKPLSGASIWGNDSFSLDNQADTQGNSSFLSTVSSMSDANVSDFLPESKRRLFDMDDDLDLTISPNKTTKR